MLHVQLCAVFKIAREVTFLVNRNIYNFFTMCRFKRFWTAKAVKIGTGGFRPSERHPRRLPLIVVWLATVQMTTGRK